MTIEPVGTNVLDNGYVMLIDHMGNDLTVVRRARHLRDAEWRGNKDVKLINYLTEHKHTSPFEFVEFDFEIKAPIFVARQWMRHRMWNYNEISGRYQELPREYYVPASSYIGVQYGTNRQGRDLSTINPAGPDFTFNHALHGVKCFDQYADALKQGEPRELARIDLPLSTYTVFSAKVDLHNLLHFLALRLDKHAQYEIRVYAEAILKLIEPIVPVSIAAWRRNRSVPVVKEEVVEKIKAMIAHLNTVHVDRLYVSKDYTLGDLRRDLKTAIGEA